MTRFAWTLACASALSFIGCGGEDNECALYGNCDPATPGVLVPAEFDELAMAINDQVAVVNEQNVAFIQSLNTLLATSGDDLSHAELIGQLDDLSREGRAFIDDLTLYELLLRAYDQQLPGSGTLGIGSQPLSGGVGPDFLVEIQGLMEKGLTAAEACKEKFPGEEQYVDVLLCEKEVEKQITKDGWGIGAAAVVGTGAGLFTALLAGSLKATIAVQLGAPIAVGLVVGFVFSKCTSSKQSGAADFCFLQSCQSPVNEIGGDKLAICDAPPGYGTLTLTIPGKAPIVVQLLLPPEGLTLDLSSCLVDVEDATPESVQACVEAIVKTEGVDVPGATCDDILSLKAGTTPIDPAPGETVGVTYEVFPKIAGCPTTYSVVGTDGYTDSGSQDTDAEGAATFDIPGGAEGVNDTVTLSETTNGSTFEVVYTF